MNALSVRQPFAELIASGRKSIEVRSWMTTHRGPLLIVASSNAHRDWYADFDLTADDCPPGVAVAVVDLCSIRSASNMAELTGLRVEACCDVNIGDYLWRLANPRRVRPFAVKGRLRLFPVSDELVRLAPAGAAARP